MRITNLLLILLVLVAACKKQNDNCQKVELTPAFIFDAPDSVEVGVSFNVTLNYVVDNSCGNQVEYEVEKYGNTLEVKMKTIYMGCSCDDGFVEKTASFPVIFDAPGTYELKFWVADNEYESYVVVAEG